MKNRNKFSVIIPLYNKEDTIYFTLERVLCQTYSFFEVIIINDGSTDKSLDIVNGFIDSRIRIFTKENGGVSSARNFGIQVASNPFLAFLDADDIWETEYLEEMNKLINSYPSCGLYACSYFVEKENKTTLISTDLNTGIVENYFREMLHSTITWTSAVVVPRKIMNETFRFPLGMIGGEDLFIWSKIALFNEVVFSNKPLARYNQISPDYYYRLQKPDSCEESWSDLLEESSDFYFREFLAKKGIDNGIRNAFGNNMVQSKKMEATFGYTKLFKRKMFFLKVINSLPPSGIRFIYSLIIFKQRIFK